MDQMLRLLSSLTLRQKISLAAAALAVSGSLAYFQNWNKERDFQVLYSNLASADASAITARLRESAVEYRLSEDGTIIKVPSAKVADLRLQMAGAGLPKSGRIGYELFDKTNFGATEFAEQINYHRALEGELERSVMGLAEIESARVHISQPKESVFLENRRPAKASVLVKLRAGAKLSAQNILAITHLVASAVEGLTPEMVSLMDAQGNLLSRPRRQEGGLEEGPSEASLDYRRNLERDLITKIHNTLEPLLGPEKYRAGVTIECDFSSGEQSEESYDPARSVMTTSQRTEDVAGAGQPNGIPGTASNLPRPTSRPGQSGQGVTRRTENIAYQSSRSVKRVHLPQGSVKRVSVSILLDHNVRFEGTGPKARRFVEAPSAERIKATRDLIAGVVGLQPERGDQVIVESLPFESTLSWEAPGANQSPPAAPAIPAIPLPAWLRTAIEKKDMLILGALGGALLVLLLGVGWIAFRLRPGKKKKTRMTMRAGNELDEAEMEALEAGNSLDKMEQQLNASRQKQEQEIINSIHLKLPSATTKKAEVLAKQLVEESKKDRTTLTQVVRTWMSDND